MGTRTRVTFAGPGVLGPFDRPRPPKPASRLAGRTGLDALRSLESRLGTNGGQIREEDLPPEVRRAVARENQKIKDGAGSVVLFFDEDRRDRFPWATSWHGAHDQKSAVEVQVFHVLSGHRIRRIARGYGRAGRRVPAPT